MTDELAPIENESDIPSSTAAMPVGFELELSWRDVMELVNGAGSTMLYYVIAKLLRSTTISDAEIDVLAKMPTVFRQSVIGELVEYAEILREGSRELDAQILRLTDSLV